MIFPAILVALLLTGPLALWLVRKLERGTRSRPRRRRRFVVMLAVLNGIFFLSYLAVRTYVAHQQKIIQAAQALAMPLGTADNPAPPDDTLPEQVDRRRGYQAGYALATDTQHRGTRIPTEAALVCHRQHARQRREQRLPRRLQARLRRRADRQRRAGAKLAGRALSRSAGAPGDVPRFFRVARGEVRVVGFGRAISST